MAKKEEVKTNFVLSEENNTKIVLIKHYLAEKGKGSEEFDKAFEDAITSAIDGMYKKLVPSAVRSLFSNSDISISGINKKNKNDSKKTEETGTEVINND